MNSKLIKLITIPAIGGFSLGLGLLAGTAFASPSHQVASAESQPCYTQPYNGTTTDPLLNVNGKVTAGNTAVGSGSGATGTGSGSGGTSSGGTTGSGGTSTGGTTGTGGTTSSGGGASSSPTAKAPLINVDAGVNAANHGATTGNSSSPQGRLINVDVNAGAANSSSGSNHNHDEGLVPKVLDSLLG